jgi:preprotein translocase subunit Sec63
MTLKEAFKILGTSKKDSEREIKSKYKKLLFSQKVFWKPVKI